MLFSTIVPLRRMPRSTPQPRTAAMALPPMVNPIFRPEYVIAAFITTPISTPKTTACQVISRYRCSVTSLLFKGVLLVVDGP
jgi:hypothetical protein